MNKKPILGIDASNIRAGGGITHLVELLKEEELIKHFFSKVILWSGEKTLQKVENNSSWLIKKNPKLLNGGLIERTFWQKYKLANAARKENCNILFVPGGSFSCNFSPVVTLSQNMLPFQKNELHRYGFSWMSLKMFFLRFVQSSSFKKADGVIFLTHFAKNTISKEIGKLPLNFSIIPHGINPIFFLAPREQKSINLYSFNKPYEILYLSIVDVYKHQWNVAEGVSILRAQGIPVCIRFVGPAYSPSLKRLEIKIQELDPKGEFIFYEGQIKHKSLPDILFKSDMFIFASSCENMPNILLEGMAAGLPIVSSDRGPMPEVLGDSGLYFNPEDPKDIAKVVSELISSPELRTQKSYESFQIAQKYSWSICASETASFLNFIATNSNC
uniref:glycosyltransferase family 4 protein n=1 Tax=Algoriphagus sp. TaxID=1872435 RepID=UPI0040481356